MSKDYYKILGIDRNASAEEIKRAFRALAHKYHPDKKGGDEAKFKEINEAYQILSDKNKRAQYDQFGAAAFENGGFGGGQGFGGFSGFQGGGFEDLGDIFGDIFGGSRSRRRTARGGDIQVDLELSFSQAVFGVEKEVVVTKPCACERCGGVGAEPGTSMKTCGNCGGSGVHVTSQHTILGIIQQKRTCSACHGNGEEPEKKCSACSGSGTETKRKNLTITVPAGVENGTVLRVRGEGEFIKGGESGDLFVQIHVRVDKRFEREGSTIFSTAQIGFTQAALGDKIEVETLDGKVELKIPAGTQSGSQMRLRGKGVPSSRGRGDQIVFIEVVTPVKLSREQKKLLEELRLDEK
ncbi:MAG: molecular chaperone DnaJ [Patescibacteria group bacterium]